MVTGIDFSWSGPLCGIFCVLGIKKYLRVKIVDKANGKKAGMTKQTRHFLDVHQFDILRDFWTSS